MLRSLLSRVIPDSAKHARRLYRYRSNVIGADSAYKKIHISKECVWRGIFDRKTILCYPQKPVAMHVLYKMILFLGYQMTTDPADKWSIAIKWFNAYDGNPFLPRKEDLPQSIITCSPNQRVLNLNCADISKDHISRVFEEVFEYAISVDPTKINGQCVAKSNWNALHQGVVIECPIEEKKRDVTYQKLICNEVSGGMVEDMRIPVFGGKVPLVYVKYRLIDDRFVDREHTNTKATIAEGSELLSKEELEKLGVFCRRLSLDYCELDVLRDKYDGRIYVVDVNNTPAGPPSPISEREANIAIMRLAQAFERTFMC